MEPNPTNPSRSSAHGLNGNDDASPSTNSNATTNPQAQHPPDTLTNAAATSTGEGLSSLERLKLFKDRVMATRGSGKEQQQQPSSHQLEKVRVAESFLSQSAPPTPTSPNPAGSSIQTNASQVSQVPIVSPADMPRILQPTDNDTFTSSQQPAQPTTPQNGENGGADDVREAREHVLKEKLRLKMAQRAAGADPSASRAPPTPATPTGAQPPPNNHNGSTTNGEGRRAREDVEMNDVQARPNGSNGHASQPPCPRDAAYAESRPAQRVEPPFDHRKSYAEAARQRFRGYGCPYDVPDNTPVQHPANRRTPSPPRRREPSPGRAPSPRRGPLERHQSPPQPVRRTPPTPREQVNPTVRYERATPAPEYPDRGHPVEPRLSYSSVSERRPYERQPAQYGEPAGPSPPSYANGRPREREYERDAQAMPPPAVRAPQVPVAARDDSPPSAANPMEAWVISQVQLLKQQQEGVAKAIAEFEKMIASGVFKAAAPAASAVRPTSGSSTSTPSRAGDYRQEYRPEPRPEQRPEQRVKYRMEHGPEQRPEQRPLYSEFRPAPQREPSPGPAPRSYEESCDSRVALSPRNQPPFGPKEYEYSDAPRFTPRESYGKAPVYKSYDNYNKQKPYDRRPYDRSPNDRGPSPTRSQYDSGRRGSWENWAPPPHPKQYDYRY
ncbi:hypothetical protein CcaverHIS002_0308750 [Cutaneotrichosporon cavernicola]|uniref:Uncharacterized protein n=1 Tax=Cutaneotrichosporon cavernicola TaxID=279322 RepID=A0AA48IAE3_9TREE|nr:uncharacterized protein CcaverHIS019_0308600 [Cutaneotrichosporon cavernicola]BEI83007.1 hypothetical protein CcaverHIS002_0308750 [Cutaneotrichosporon cavernicola]BEI90790.1 hypothetical protein CcaverHIS019_0308600 [Cutaneotrichosporon cavernicola]BEI98569.1 hypothetical protein CcaverHIS631_0308680 [Cutaneotrichosporon cavernicola]BEJ06339.1 hypothetical protein CcaverHIS641_0308610 [Cutaneotrichosporon cavernicola]